MAHLNKEQFPENVRIYVDKTKTEILNSFSEILDSHDSLEEKLEESKQDYENVYNKYYHLKSDFNNLAKHISDNKANITTMYISFAMNIVFAGIIIYMSIKA